MVSIRKHLVSATVAKKVTSGTNNTRKKICIHETDNTAKGSKADNHARLQANGNSRQASWHWSTDDKEAVQSFEHKYQCWAAGTPQGNDEAIHIEMCVNSDGNYKKTVQNTAELVAKILKEEKLTINDVVQHNHYSGKNCPRNMRSTSAQVPWGSFLQMVKSNLAQSNEKEETTVGKEVYEKDVVPATWAKDAVEWAKRNGVSDGTYLKRPATREEIITMIYNVQNKK